MSPAQLSSYQSEADFELGSTFPSWSLRVHLDLVHPDLVLNSTWSWKELCHDAEQEQDVEDDL